MESTDQPLAQQDADAPVDPVRLRAEALSVVLSYLALMQPHAAFNLLEYLHSAAGHAPDHADTYYVAVEDLREVLGFDRLRKDREL